MGTFNACVHRHFALVFFLISCLKLIQYKDSLIHRCSIRDLHMLTILRRAVIKPNIQSFRYFATINQKKMAAKKALALLATGSEEMELVITVDVLRRAGVS